MLLSRRLILLGTVQQYFSALNGECVLTRLKPPRDRPNGCELSGRGSLGQILFQDCEFALSLAPVVELASAHSPAHLLTHMATVSCFCRGIPGPIQRVVMHDINLLWSAQHDPQIADLVSPQAKRIRRRPPHEKSPWAGPGPGSRGGAAVHEQNRPFNVRNRPFVVISDHS